VWHSAALGGGTRRHSAAISSLGEVPAAPIDGHVVWVHWNLIEAIHEHSLQLGAWAAVEEPKGGRGGLMKPSACMHASDGGRYQWQFVGHSWPSVAIRCHHGSSVALTLMREAINGHHGSSVALTLRGMHRTEGEGCALALASTRATHATRARSSAVQIVA
jgi:hypothetical protein